MDSPKIVIISSYDNYLSPSALDRKMDPINQMPSASFYPYGELTVPGANTQVFVCATSADQITPELREELVRRCGDYGPENAEKGVPSVEKLQAAWRGDALNRTPRDQEPTDAANQ